MRTRRQSVGRGAAWVITLVAAAMLAVAFLLQLRSPAGLSLLGDLSVLQVLTPLISCVVGAIVVARVSNHPVGWLFCLSGFGWALYQLGYTVGVLAPSDATAVQLLLWSTTWSSLLAFGFVPVLVIYVFPNGRLASPRWRWMFGTTILFIAVGAIAYSFVPGPLEDLTHITNPYGVGGTFGAICTFIATMAWPIFIVCIAGGVLSLWRRRPTATAEERQQIKWLFLAGVVLLLFVVFWGVMELSGRPGIAVAISGLFLPLLPLALGTAILRHRLYDIDVLINKTLVYGTLSAVLAVFYLGVVVVLQRLLAGLTTDSNLAVAASTLAVAAAFRPLRARVQSFIDRRFYRSKYNAAATVQGFSSRLRSEVDLGALENDLLSVVASTLQPSTAGVWLKSSEWRR